MSLARDMISRVTATHIRSSRSEIAREEKERPCCIEGLIRQRLCNKISARPLSTMVDPGKPRSHPWEHETISRLTSLQQGSDLHTDDARFFKDSVVTAITRTLSVLLAVGLLVGSILGLLLNGYLQSRFGSRRVYIVSCLWHSPCSENRN